MRCLEQTLTQNQMRGYLEKVYIRTEVSGDELICSVPLFRQDIAAGADIAEEVARMYGYDNIVCSAHAVRG